METLYWNGWQDAKANYAELIAELVEALELTQDGSELYAAFPEEWSIAAAKDYEQICKTLAKVKEIKWSTHYPGTLHLKQ